MWVAVLVIVLALLAFVIFVPLALPLLDIHLLQDSDLILWVDVVKSFVETVAIIIAGYWTYDRFIKSREDHPYPKISHDVKHFFLKDGWIYVSVFVTVVNEGKAKLTLRDGGIHIRKVKPLSAGMYGRMKKANYVDVIKGHARDIFIEPEKRVGWGEVGIRRWEQLPEKYRELEPGQTREIQVDFLFKDGELEVLEVISSFRYEKSAWDHATFHLLN